MSARGGNPVQVTQHGGTYAKESIDRKYIYYGRTGPSTALWRVPVAGGEEMKEKHDAKKGPGCADPSH